MTSFIKVAVTRHKKRTEKKKERKKRREKKKKEKKSTPYIFVVLVAGVFSTVSADLSEAHTAATHTHARAHVHNRACAEGVCGELWHFVSRRP